MAITATAADRRLAGRAKQLFRCEARKLVGDHEGRSSGKYVLRPAEGLCVKLPLLSMVDRDGSIRSCC